VVWGSRGLGELHFVKVLLQCVGVTVLRSCDEGSCSVRELQCGGVAVWGELPCDGVAEWESCGKGEL